MLGTYMYLMLCCALLFFRCGYTFGAQTMVWHFLQYGDWPTAGSRRLVEAAVAVQGMSVLG